jgi:tRNA A-37 threonylcarbamoyl transferase component Bud32
VTSDIDQYRLGFRSTLEEIHQAGILHGDIRRQNLLINDSGEVAIIDFDQSMESPSTEAMAQEMGQLVDLLHSEGCVDMSPQYM